MASILASSSPDIQALSKSITTGTSALLPFTQWNVSGKDDSIHYHHRNDSSMSIGSFLLEASMLAIHRAWKDAKGSSTWKNNLSGTTKHTITAIASTAVTTIPQFISISPDDDNHSSQINNTSNVKLDGITLLLNSIRPHQPETCRQPSADTSNTAFRRPLRLLSLH
jgi:hypothetical protein